MLSPRATCAMARAAVVRHAMAQLAVRPLLHPQATATRSRLQHSPRSMSPTRQVQAVLHQAPHLSVPFLQVHWRSACVLGGSAHQASLLLCRVAVAAAVLAASGATFATEPAEAKLFSVSYTIGAVFVGTCTRKPVPTSF